MTQTSPQSSPQSSPQTSPQRADALRNVEAILDAAEACLARDPDASMGEIATAAGLGRVTLYAHFGSRAALVEAVVARVLTRVNGALETIDVSGDPALALERLIEATWQLTMRAGALVVAAERAVPAASLQAAHAGPLSDRVERLIAAGQTAGVFDPALPRSWLVAMVHAVIHAAATEIDAGRLTSAEAPAVITRTLLGAFGHGGEPASGQGRTRRPRASRASGA